VRSNSKKRSVEKFTLQLVMVIILFATNDILSSNEVVLANDHILLIALIVIFRFTVVKDLGIHSISEAYQEASDAIRDVNTFVVQLPRMDKDLALLKLDRLSETTEVGATTLILVQSREHGLPRHITAIVMHLDTRVVRPFIQCLIE